MWKPLALAAAILLPGTALAGNIHLTTGDEDHCSAELNQAVRAGPGFLEIREDREDRELLVHFQSPAQLVVHGKTVELDEHQQQLMRDYHSQLHGAGREVLLISLEAVDVALNGMSVALTALAGPDHPDNIELQQASEELLRRVEARLNREGEIYTLGDPDIDEFIEQTIEEEFEPKIEKLAMESAGTIAWHALKAAFTGGRSIERRAEEAAEQIEQKMDRQAEQLERRAEGLCGRLESIDRLEGEMHKSIPVLAPYDIVEID